MSLIKFFDTETTGIPDWKQPSEDPIQPHMVQLCCILADSETQEVASELDVIIRPDDWIITPEMTAIHGITHERAMDEGIPEAEALEQYLAAYQQADLRVAHNTTFDNRIIRIALKRYQPERISDDEWKDKARYYCTMTEHSKRFGGKWPKLEEAYEALTGKKLEGAHNALFDARACMEIYFALKALEALPA